MTSSARALTNVAAMNAQDISRYFEYANKGVAVEEDGLKEIAFGEYLVEQQALDRFQLFRSLQMQDRNPGLRLGEADAALGSLPIGAFERLYAEFAQLGTVAV